MMGFMAWMGVMIFIPVFAPSLPILAWGEAMCGVSWGVFQTLSTAYASEGSFSDLLFLSHNLFLYQTRSSGSHV